MIGGEFLQFLQRFGSGDGIRKWKGTLVVGEGLVLVAQGQVGQATVKIETRLLLALNGGGVAFNNGGVVFAGEGELAQAGVGVGMGGPPISSPQTQISST